MNVQNFEPEIILSWTDDGGHEWAGFVEVSLGQQGQYDREIRVNRLGQSGIHGRAYRIEFSAACKFALVGAMADVTELAA